MIKSFSAASLAVLTLMTPLAYAQTLDMEKLRCEELSRVYFDQFPFFDAWMSGYYHGKKGETVVDAKKFAANAQKVLQFCRANPNVFVMQAIDRLMTTGG